MKSTDIRYMTLKDVFELGDIKLREQPNQFSDTDIFDLSNVNYFKKDTYLIYFSLYDFIKTQGCIANKFPNPKETEIEMIDSFILHIIEEAEECKYEINNDNKKEMIEEFVDCIMYTFSFFYTYLQRNYKYFDAVKHRIINEKSYLVPLSVEYDDYSKLLREQKYIKEDIINIVTGSFIWKLRRLFPERKYHKRYKELTEQQRIDRFVEVFNIFETTIQRLVTKLYYDSHYDINSLNKVFITKQNYILNGLEKI